MSHGMNYRNAGWHGEWHGPCEGPLPFPLHPTPVSHLAYPTHVAPRAAMR